MTELELLEGLIAAAVPKAYSLCQAFAPPTELAGSTLGTVVREFLIHACSSTADERGWGRLSFSVGFNRSVVFTDQSGRDVRVRKLPVDWRSRREASLPTWNQGALFEYAASGNPSRLLLGAEELVVLWRPNPASAELDNAVLAAVRHLDEGVSRIVDFVPLKRPGYLSEQDIEALYNDFFGSVGGLLGPEQE